MIETNVCRIKQTNLIKNEPITIAWTKSEDINCINLNATLDKNFMEQIISISDIATMPIQISNSNKISSFEFKEEWLSI